MGQVSLRVLLSLSLSVVIYLSSLSMAGAALRFIPVTDARGTQLLISGQFEHSDRLEPFAELVRQYSVVVVNFDSSGGNPFKAMELGRLIRLLQLSTIQGKEKNCASACALAFLGGVRRFAEPGSIGIHKTAFPRDAGIGIEDAVSVVQSATAAMMTYLSEMGADPALLELALRYEADDMRYLSKSEMKRYKVTNIELPVANEEVASRNAMPGGEAAPREHAPPSPKSPGSINTGRVRHPSGGSPLKSAADNGSRDLLMLANGTAVSILSTEPDWYRVQVGTSVGYLHHTWTLVDQYKMGNFDNRFIQVKSLANQRELKRTLERPLCVLRCFRRPTDGLLSPLRRQLSTVVQWSCCLV